MLRQMRACCLIVVMCMIALCIAVPRQQAVAASAIPYGGDEVAFVADDLSSPLGMFSNPSGDMQVTRENGSIRISFTPKNRTIFCGFYLNASIDDESTWSYYIPALGESGSYAYDFTLPESYCGYAWPIAPLKPEAGGSSGTRTTSEQYYLAIPPAGSAPVLTFTVTFTDGYGSVISTAEVQSGEDATPPADPVREGYVFDGWDGSFANVTENRTINAKWRIPEGEVGYTVTFVDGFGGTIATQLVREGDAAVAPADPVRDGYTFTGWKPVSFSAIWADLTVVAQWLNNDQLTIDAVRDAIAALPNDPKDVLRDTGNEAVANAAAAYNALSGDLQAQIPDDERLKLARCAIAVLPSDPYKVSAEHGNAIGAAQAVVGSLPGELQAELDSYDGDKAINSSRSYGRYLENAEWALDSLRGVNNVTMLKNGTYTGQVSSASSMGKSNSRRALSFTVKSIKVTGGKMTAIIEHGSNSSQSLKLGGEEFQNLQDDPTKNSYFEIPLCLNSTFHFSVKGKNATDDTDAITYEMTVTADEGAMTPDAAGGSGSGSGAGAKGAGVVAAGSGTNLNTLVNSSTNANAAASKSAESASKTSAGKKDGSAKNVQEVSVPTTGAVATAYSGTDWGPAVAGFALLFVSAGALAFTMRFIRREAAGAQGAVT